MRSQTSKIIGVQEKIRLALFDLNFEDYEKALKLIEPLETFLNLKYFEILHEEELDYIKSKMTPERVKFLREFYDNMTLVTTKKEFIKHPHLAFLYQNDVISAVQLNDEEIMFMSNFRTNEILNMFKDTK